MDAKLLVNKLNFLFLKADREAKRYEKLWLCEWIVGKKYELHIRLKQPLKNRSEEVRYTFELLKEIRSQTDAFIDFSIHEPRKPNELRKLERPKFRDFIVYTEEDIYKIY